MTGHFTTNPELGWLMAGDWRRRPRQAPL